MLSIMLYQVLGECKEQYNLQHAANGVYFFLCYRDLLMEYVTVYMALCILQFHKTCCQILIIQQ